MVISTRKVGGTRLKKRGRSGVRINFSSFEGGISICNEERGISDIGGEEK